MKCTQDFSSIPLSIAFIDDTLDDVATLYANLSKNIRIHLLSDEKNILSQMSDVMSDLTGIKSIHLFTHGSSGEIKLGSNGVSLETLPAYGKDLMAISNAMKKDGEIYLYGCEVAAGERGAAFVKMLGDITELKVAASTHKVGHSELGGNWELDVAPQTMSGALEVSEWRGMLSPLDTTPPRLTNISWSGSTVTLTYDEALTEANVPDAAMYVVKVNGVSVNLADSTPVAVSGSAVTLTLASALQADDKVLVSYGDLMNNGAWIRDASADSNNFAEFFNDLAVAPLGGVPAEGNLRVTVLDDGTMVIDRYDGTAWNTQFYDGDVNQTDALYGAVSSGNIIEINGKTVPLGNYAGFGTSDVIMSPVPMISASGNTITVVWTIDSSIVVGGGDSVVSTGAVVVTQHITLPSETSQSVNIEWDITNNTGSELTYVRLARVVDSFLAGGDNGSGISIPSQNSVGVQKLTETGIQQMLLTSTGDITPADVQSGDYQLVLDAAATAGEGLQSVDDPNTATDIEGVNSDPETDNGYAMEWVIPTLANNATATIATTESFVASSVTAAWGDGAAPSGAVGEEITLTFDIANVSGVEKTANYTVEVPDGWNAAVLSVTSNTFSAASDDNGTTHDETTNTATVTVKVTPPAGAAGNYDVVLKSTVGTTTVQAVGAVTVTVPDGLSGVTASHTFTEAELQAAPQLLDTEVTFNYEDAKLTKINADTYAKLYVQYVNIDPNGSGQYYDATNDTYYDPSHPDSYTNYQVGNNVLSLKSDEVLQFNDDSEGDGDIIYDGATIGYLRASNNGFSIYFDQGANPTAAMIDKIIESITLSVNDYPVEQSKFRIVLEDNIGATTDPVYVDVAVSAENDAPVLSTAVGLKTVDVPTSDYEYEYSVQTLGDGSIIVAGMVASDPDPDDNTDIGIYTILTKYSADGTLDTTFGTNGTVTIAPAEEFDNPQIAIDGNGKIVVVGIHGYTDTQLSQWDTVKSIGVMRYNADGTLDTTFAANTDNIATYRKDGIVDMYNTPKVAIFSDNGIAVTYPGDGSDFAVVKFTNTGGIDTNFGTGGVKFIDMDTSSSDEVSDMKIDASGNIVLVGSVEDASSGVSSVGLAVLNGTTGVEIAKTVTSAVNADVWSPLEEDMQADTVAIQGDGKIVVAGTADWSGLILARYTSAGVIDDTTFGTDGKVGLTEIYSAQDIAIDSNGKILVLSNDEDMSVVRLNTNGSIDTTFGENGVATVTSGDNPWGAALKIATDGTIWIVGGDDESKFNIAKLSANGIPDATFGDKATYTTYGDPIILDGAISIFDGELSDNDNDDYYFNGATLTVARQGGANALDHFSAAEDSYLVLGDNGVLEYDGYELGTYTNANGQLSITFNGDSDDVEPYLVNGVMRSIAYQYGDDTVEQPSDINLVWTFNDGNTGDNGRTDQGSGGALSTTLVQTLNIAIGEPPTPPEITSTPLTTVDEGTQYNYTLSATDDTEVTWSVKADTELPDWLTLGKGDAAVTLADTFVDPGGMAYDEATGDIYATANSAFSVMFSDGLLTSKIYKIDADGTKTLFTEQQPGQIGSMVVVDGYLYAGYVQMSENSATEGLYRYDLSDTDGSVTPELVMSGDITGVALHDGKIYVTDYELGTVFELDPASLTVPIADDNLSNYVYVDLSNSGAIPYGITFDSDGVMYGTFYMSGSVFKYDGTNTPEIIMSADNGDIPDGNPTDIKVDAAGNLYISYMSFMGDGIPGIYKFDSDLNPLDPISTTANTWSMIINNDGKIIAGDIQINSEADTVEEAFAASQIFGIDTANYSLSGIPPMVNADTEYEVTLVATDADGSETEHTFTITVRDVPEPINSVTLNVNNPFTTNDLNDTTPITIDAPEGINITNATNSEVSGLPKNVKMPLGKFGFTLDGLATGATVQMSMTADADFKQFSYFKKNLITNKWVNIAEGVTINDNGTATVKFSLTDGGAFDADGVANGVIVDPGGIGENALLPMIAENTTEVGSVSLLDDDAVSGTLSYAITGGTDTAKFNINATTGLLSFNSAPDYENPTDTGDTAANNTYALQVTITGSTSGTEVQNLIISVLNVAEEGDNPNTAPVIIGLRAEAQSVTVGTAAALDDIHVADVNNNTMTVTLSATNGAIGGLTDADLETDGIQLTGTATQINTALAAATFTATAAGTSGVSISVVDGNLGEGQGIPITTTAFYGITASAAPTPPPSQGGSYTPPPASTTIIRDTNLSGATTTPVTQTISGNTVITQSATGTRTYEDINGNSVIKSNVTVEAIKVVAPSNSSNSGTASVPLYWAESSKSQWATTATISSGVSLSSEGNRAPTATQTKTTALDDLIYYIQTTVQNADSAKTTMIGGGSSFLSELSNAGTLVVNKVTLSADVSTNNSAPATISLNGTQNSVTTNGITDTPKEALVIDASVLPSQSTILLNNIEFGVIIGENLTIRGGEGQNKVFTGEGSQDIMCGEDDDELHAGAGDDTVGSAGGDDKIFGEAGNDTVFGGEGDDLLHGGSQTDIATYSGNMADYIITRDEGKTYVALASNPNEIDTLINVETITFADNSYTVESTAVHEKIATLYTQVFDRQADIDGFQYWAHDYNDGLSLGGLVVSFMKIADSSWNTKNTSEQIEMLYEYVIGHPSDVEGKNYWINDIQNNHMTIEDVAECFIDLLGQYQLKDDWNFSL